MTDFVDLLLVLLLLLLLSAQVRQCWPLAKSIWACTYPCCCYSLLSLAVARYWWLVLMLLYIWGRILNVCVELFSGTFSHQFPIYAKFRGTNMGFGNDMGTFSKLPTATSFSTKHENHNIHDGYPHRSLHFWWQEKTNQSIWFALSLYCWTIHQSQQRFQLAESVIK